MPDDHRIAVAERHEQRGEHVAVLIDHAPHIALKEPAPLEAFIEERDHFRYERGNCGIVNLVAVRIAHAEFGEQIVHGLGAANQNRGAIAEIAVLDRRAQHDFVFRFGEHDALGVCLDLRIDIGEHRGRRVEPCFQLGAIGVEILDRLLGHARIHRGLGDGGRNHFHEARDRTGRG